jgi:arylsulfatase A
MQSVAFRHLAAVLAVAAFAAAPAPGLASPNIVFILADDMGIGDVGITNQNARAQLGLPSFATPNIDSIALNGARFNNFYTGAGNCSPSRNVLLTGFHQRHVLFEQANLDADIRPGEQDKTWAKVLQEGGYATGMFGKWHLGGVNSSATAIRTPSAMPSGQGFSTAYGPMQFDFRMAFHWATDGSGGMVKVPTPPEPTWPGPGLPNVFGDTLVANHAVDFIRANAVTGQPFAAYVPFMAPHIPLPQVPQDHPYANMPDWPQEQRNYAGMMYYLDQHVGQILNAINDPNNDGDQSDGVAENTIVIFASDNGALAPGTLNGSNPFFFGSNLNYFGYKNMSTEGGIRTPFFVQWKGTIAPGAENNMVGTFADILPTFAELTGQDAPLGIDGVSFASELTGAGPSERPDSYSWSMVREIGAGNPAGWTIRVGDWKLAKLQPTAAIPTVTYRLFNLALDPSELTNRASQRPDIVAALEAIGIAEGSELEPYGPSPDTPGILERTNTYFTQYKTWQPQNGSVDFMAAANWAGGTPRDRPTAPEANFWNTSPAANWLATMVNTTPEAQVVTLQADAGVLALGVAGQLAEMRVNVPTGRTLSARNGIRISSGGVIHVTGGELNTTREVEVRPGGRLEGHGTINGQQQVIAGIADFAGKHLFEPRVSNEGEINVGAADVAGILQIKGEYVQEDDGTLHFDLFGSGGVAGVDFDRLAIDDNAELGGLLEIALGPGAWTPQLGNTFEILTAAGGITGTFSSLSAPVLESGLGWNFIYTPTSVSLQVIQQAIADVTIALGHPLGASVTVNAPQALNVAGTLSVGDGASAGNLTINTGGVVNAAAQTRIEPAGALTLAGGVLNTPKLDNTHGGTFHWQSGTLHLTSSLAVTAGGDLGGALAVGAGRTLDVDGSIDVSDGSLSIDSNGNVAAADGTVIGAGGVVQLQGGILATGALTTISGGTFEWSAGTLQMASELTIAQGRALADATLGAHHTLRSLGLRIGSGADAGSLSVEAGSVVQVAGTTFVEAMGVLTVDSGDFSTHVLQLDGGRYEAENLAGVGAVTFNAGEMAIGADLTLTASGPLGSTPAIGANQKLSVDGQLHLGGVGDGVMLTIGSGGNVVVAGDTTVGAASALAIDGGRLETAGIVGEAGAMFGWQSGTLRFTGDLEIAPAADLGNAVEIAGGQNLEVAGALHATNGELTAGSGGTIAVDGAVDIGAAGALAIEGGKVSLAGLTVAAGGTVDWQVGELAFTGDATVDAQGGVREALGGQAEIGPDRHLNIHGTATLNTPLRIAGGTFSAGQISGLANLVFDTGTLNLPNANLFVDVGGPFGPSLILMPASQMNVGGTTFVGSQSIIIVNDDGGFSSNVLENQGTITLGGAGARLSSSNQIVNTGRINGAGSVFGAVSNQDGGQVHVESGRRLHFLGNVDNTATLLATGSTVSAAELAFSGLVTNHFGGQLTASHATVRFDGGVDNRGRLFFSGGNSQVFGNIENTGQIDVGEVATATFHGNLIHNGTLRVNVLDGVPSTAVFLGDVTGSGDAVGGGNVVFEGRVSPGNSVDTMAFQTNVEFGASSTLAMELGGLAGIDSDQFLVDGRASLGGTLFVDLINDFVPTVGENFTLMLSTQGITGTFDQVILPEVPGIDWQLNYSLLTVMLKAIEGPPAMQADFDSDGDVDGHDFLAWQRGLGKTNAQLSDGDANADGVVDGADLAAWRSAFGSQSAAAAVQAVPEPATASLAIAAVAPFAAARLLRRRGLQ